MAALDSPVRALFDRIAAAAALDEPDLVAIGKGSVEVQTVIRRLGTREGSVIFAFLVPGVTEFYVDYNFAYPEEPAPDPLAPGRYHVSVTTPHIRGFGGLSRGRSVRRPLTRVRQEPGPVPRSPAFVAPRRERRATRQESVRPESYNAVVELRLSCPKTSR